MVMCAISAADVQMEQEPYEKECLVSWMPLNQAKPT
jgi:hypothetical protein